MSWRKLSSTIVYENDWMTVFEDRVINPGGGENQYVHVHFKNVAVAIIPVDENDATRLVGQDRYTLSEYSWELPMGGAPEGEDPLLAAKRELKEETGITAEKWTEIMRLHISNSITDEVGIVYVAENLTLGETFPEETEDLSIKVLPIDEAIQMAIDGDITDAISVAALLRLAISRRPGGR